MSTEKQIIISGVGGQGMILCGTLIAQAAVLHDGRRATLSSEYGVETRGTFAKSDVIISDEEIYFPDATEPDLVLCLAQPAYERYAGTLPPDVPLVYNTDEVTPRETGGRQLGVAIDHLARQLGNPATANIITMGIAAGLLDAVTPEGAKAAIAGFFAKKGEKVIALNQKAFEEGLKIGRELKK